MPSLVTVACVRPGRAKDLSTPPHTRKNKDRNGEERRFRAHQEIQSSPLPPEGTQYILLIFQDSILNLCH